MSKEEKQNKLILPSKSSLRIFASEPFSDFPVLLQFASMGSCFRHSKQQLIRQVNTSLKSKRAKDNMKKV